MVERQFALARRISDQLWTVDPSRRRMRPEEREELRAQAIKTIEAHVARFQAGARQVVNVGPVR